MYCFAAFAAGSESAAIQCLRAPLLPSAAAAGMASADDVALQDSMERVTIAEAEKGRRAFMRGSEEIVPLGGNYVLKGFPYSVPLRFVTSAEFRSRDTCRDFGFRRFTFIIATCK